MTLQFDPNLHYACIQCGRSCTGWNVWLSPEVAAPLRGLDITLRVVQERGAAFEVERGQLKMVRSDEHPACGFLRSDKLCSIHAELRYQSKPLGCQQFPFLMTRLPDGTRRVGASFSCTAVQQGSGPPLEASRADFEDIDRLGAAFVQVPSSLQVVPGLEWDWDEMQAFEQRFRSKIQGKGWQEALFESLIALGQMVRAQPGALEAPLGLLGQVLTASLLKPCLHDQDRQFWALLDQAFLGECDLTIPEFAWSGPIEALQSVIQDQVAQRFDSKFDQYREALWFRQVHFLQGDLASGLLLLWSLRDILRLLTALHASKDGCLPGEKQANKALVTVETSLVAHSANGTLVFQQLSQAWLAMALHHT